MSNESRGFILGSAVLATIIYLSTLVFGCMSEDSKRLQEYNRSSTERLKQRQEACIKLGGVPIMSGWTNDLARCDFPPQQPVKQ